MVTDLLSAHCSLEVEEEEVGTTRQCVLGVGQRLVGVAQAKRGNRHRTQP